MGESVTEVIVPKNEDDYNSDAILELRVGTGGDEACLFCADSLRAYQNIAQKLQFKFNIISMSKTDVRGVKEVAASISSMRGSGRGDLWTLLIFQI